MARNEWIRTRASKQDKEKLEIIRKHEGLENASETVRKLIYDKYQEIVGKIKKVNDGKN
jgi:hypothetical protein